MNRVAYVQVSVGDILDARVADAATDFGGAWEGQLLDARERHPVGGLWYELRRKGSVTVGDGVLTAIRAQIPREILAALGEPALPPAGEGMAWRIDQAWYEGASLIKIAFVEEVGE